MTHALPILLIPRLRQLLPPVTYCFYSALAFILYAPSAIGRPTVWRRCRLMLVGPRYRGHRVWADKIAAPALSLEKTLLGAPSVEFPEGFRSTALRMAGTQVNKHIRAPVLSIWNLRFHEGSAALRPWPSVAVWSARHCTVGPHEKNARQCDSTGRVASCLS